jgi:hypothetical protein
MMTKRYSAALIAAITMTSTLSAATIDQVKAKPAKYIVETTAPADQVTRCLKKVYGEFTLNIVDNPDQTQDAEISLQGHRYALFTIAVDTSQITIQSRGQIAVMVENPHFRECIGLPAKAIL